MSRPSILTKKAYVAVSQCGSGPFTKRDAMQRLRGNLNLVVGGSEEIVQLVDLGLEVAVHRALRRKLPLQNGNHIRLYVATSSEQDAKWYSFANSTDSDLAATIGLERRKLRDMLGVTAEEYEIIHDLLVAEHANGNTSATFADVAAMEL